MDQRERLIRRTLTLLRWHLGLQALCLVTAVVLALFTGLNSPFFEERAYLWLLPAGALVLLGLVLGVIGWRADFPLAWLTGFGLPVLGILLFRFAEPLHGVSATVAWLVLAVGVILAPALPFVALASGPRLQAPRPGGQANAAASVRSALLRQAPHRFRGRTFSVLARIALLPGTLLLILLVGMAFIVERPPGLAIAFLAAAGVVGWGLAKVGRLGAAPYRLEADDTAERTLIETIESGTPFGLYLRPFGPGSGLDWLTTDPPLPFFALADLEAREPSRPGIDPIWVPGHRWNRVAFPLMSLAVVTIVRIPDDWRLRPYSGLHAELSYASENRLADRLILVVPPRPDVPAFKTEGVPSPERIAVDRTAALISKFPHRFAPTDVAAIHRRIAVTARG